MENITDPVPASQARWYVIQCKAREEGRAREHLERQNFRCYLPTIRIERLRKGRRQQVLEPLFPNYVFIQLNATSDNWHTIRSTRGVLKIVRFGESPTPVPDPIIQTIQVRLTNQPLAIPYLNPGEPVRIVHGPFNDIEAMFIANDGAERVILLMNILAREQTLSFPAASVCKLRGHHGTSATQRTFSPLVFHTV
jgi:transcriptional antiterminator RfaH